MTVGDRRYATRVLSARENAVKNGHKWWPASKRSLNDYPTEHDIAWSKRPPKEDQ